MRREYWMRLKINGRTMNRVIIDSHYEQRHLDSMNDTLILALVRKLDGNHYKATSHLKSGYEIFVNDPWYFNNKPYRLIWTLHPTKDYVGVINAFRRKHEKKY